MELRARLANTGSTPDEMQQLKNGIAKGGIIGRTGTETAINITLLDEEGALPTD